MKAQHTLFIDILLVRDYAKGKRGRDWAKNSCVLPDVTRFDRVTESSLNTWCRARVDIWKS